MEVVNRRPEEQWREGGREGGEMDGMDVDVIQY